MSAFPWTVWVGLVLVAVLLGARVAEVMAGHIPSPELNVAFGAAVTGELALLARSSLDGR